MEVKLIVAGYWGLERQSAIACGDSAATGYNLKFKIIYCRGTVAAPFGSNLKNFVKILLTLAVRFCILTHFR